MQFYIYYICLLRRANGNWLVADNDSGWLDNDSVAYHRKVTADSRVDDRTGCGIHYTVFDFW